MLERFKRGQDKKPDRSNPKGYFMMGRTDSSYDVRGHDWYGGASPDDPSIDEAYEVLSQVDRFYGMAIESLANTPISNEEKRPKE